ncbi:LysR substrate-binding domain-containing protein [Serratia ureilytica]|uniref:LysR substrate-binding domain-containing protein n=1 Tax=Serratia ureilytica TaxID=300181 RepID=UPI00371644A3
MNDSPSACTILPELLADFLVLHPHTDIVLEEQPSPAIAQAIAERAADIGIVADHADLRGLTSYPFRQDRLNSWRYAAAARCGCGRVRLISTPSAAWCCAAPGWR